MGEISRRRWRTKGYWAALSIFTMFRVSINSTSSMALMPSRRMNYRLRIPMFDIKNGGDGDSKLTDDSENTKSMSSNITPVTNLDMKTYQLRKRKIMFQSRQQRWHQPPNPMLEEPIEFVQAILVALQQRKRDCAWNGALCLLQSSTPSWRKNLLNSVGAPSHATNYQVAPSLQNALERPNNQFAILTKKLDEYTINDNNFNTTINAIQNLWHFPSDPLIFEGDENFDLEDGKEAERVIEHCWVESRLRSPSDDRLLAVVGWSLQRRQIIQEVEQAYNSSDFDRYTNDLSSFWLLDGIDWQDFREKYRPGIGREEWERICG